MPRDGAKVCTDYVDVETRCPITPKEKENIMNSNSLNINQNHMKEYSLSTLQTMCALPILAEGQTESDETDLSDPQVSNDEFMEAIYNNVAENERLQF